MKQKDSVTAYAKMVVAGKKICGKAEFDACKRHLADLKRKDLEWHPEIAEYHIEFAEMLTYFDDNEKIRKKVELRGFQKFIIGSVFGWYKDGIRRFNETYIQLARKNGKSFLAAFFCLDFALVDAIENGQIYTSGTIVRNARIVWEDVKHFIEYDAELSSYFKITNSTSEILCKKNGTKIMALSGDSKTRDGFKVYHACVDEFHLYPAGTGTQLYKTLIDGMSSIDNALVNVITTAGFDLQSPCYRQYKYAKQVVSGVITADELFVFICEPDLPNPHTEPDKYEEMLWNKENWAKANPLLLFDDDCHVTKKKTKWKKFLSEGQKAKENGGEDLRNFLTKKLNVFCTVGTDAYVSLIDWEACGSRRTLEAMRGRSCYLGIDLSAKNDLTSIALVFPADEKHPLPYIYSHSFIPKGTVARHISRDRAPFDFWIQHGLCTATDAGGKNEFVLDYKCVLNKIKELKETYNLKFKMAGYDAMGIGGILSDLSEIVDGDIVEILQTPKALNDAVRNFQQIVKGHGLEYNEDNELLTWSICNAETFVNANHYMGIDKKQAERRIDAVDSIIDAWCCAMVENKNIAEMQKNEKIVTEWLDIMSNL